MKDRKISAEIKKLISFVCELLRTKSSKMVFHLMNSHLFLLYVEERYNYYCFSEIKRNFHVSNTAVSLEELFQ